MTHASTHTYLSVPSAGEYDPYYHRYVSRIPPGTALERLTAQQQDFVDTFGRLDERAALRRYAPGKWSVKEVLGHLTDTERIFAHRAFRFARADTTPLPGFDENAYVPTGGFDRREIASLLRPEQLEQYNLWFSPSAYRVRDSFFAMEPSEEDFLAIYEIQRAFDEKWREVEGTELGPAVREDYEQAQRDYEASIREYLGEERYAEYQKSRDDDFQQLQAAAAQFG